MKSLQVFLALLTFLLIVPSVLADDGKENYSFKMGLGIVGTPTTEIKTFALRQEGNLFLMFKDSTEFGLWTDTGEAKGRKGAVYGQYQLGIRPQSEHLYAKAYIGASLISSTDSQLGGIFQFAEDIGVGFQDGGSFVGLNYSHKSSAGIFKPNKGRDFLTVEMGIRF